MSREVEAPLSLQDPFGRQAGRWLPAQMSQAELRQTRDMWLVGRLQPGINVQQAQAELDIIARSAILGSFTGLALLLAVVGVYGVMHYWVAERVREIGLRMALGARQLDTVVQVVGTAAKLAIIGIALGIVAGAALSRMLAHQVQGVQPADPLMIGILSLLMFAAATLAGLVPARWAAQVDPLTSLRSE